MFRRWQCLQLPGGGGANNLKVVNYSPIDKASHLRKPASSKKLLICAVLFVVIKGCKNAELTA